MNADKNRWHITFFSRNQEKEGMSLFFRLKIRHILEKEAHLYLSMKIR